VAYPTAASLAFNATTFPIFAQMQLKTNNNAYLSGAIAGAVIAPIDYAFDVGKIRRQTLTIVPMHLKGSRTFCAIRDQRFGIRLSLRQARAADPTGNFLEPEWTMTQFEKDFGAIATYERGHMTCEILSKSARERGIQYPSTYQPLRKVILTAKIQMVAKKHHEIQRHLTQTELWWETATKTSV